MGCVHSGRDPDDARPNEFRVMNVDEFGNGLWSGRLEVADSELVLGRRGKEPTRWPLRSLRRYGFDGEIFSFESGRRCATGEGIYAFRCKRAEQLFNALQQRIQSRNRLEDEGALDGLAPETPSRPPGTPPRPAADARRSAAGRTRADRPEADAGPGPGPPRGRPRSLGGGSPSPEARSPGSPSSANILEVMPLAPLPSAGPQVSNVYQLRDFPRRRGREPDADGRPPRSAGDVNADLAALRPSLKTRRTLDEDDAPAGAAPEPPSPTASGSYATLSALEGDDRLYANLAPGDAAALLDGIDPEAERLALRARRGRIRDLVDVSEIEIEEEAHDYANLGPGEVNYDPRLLALAKGNPAPFPVPLEPDAGAKINYAVLDLDKSEPEAGDGAPAPGSPKRPAIGYTTIDFAKTEALTSVALGTEVDTEGSRKTRHNSAPLPPSPTT